MLHRPYVIGVAGSTGKSSTRNALYAVLKNHLNVKLIHGNSETGIPLGILGIKPRGFTFKDWVIMLLKCPFGIFYIREADYIIVEMGIDEPRPPKNMSYLLSIVRPNIAISLNVSATHTMQFDSLLVNKSLDERETHTFLLQKIAEEDTKIITESGSQYGIYNADNRFIRDVISGKKITTPTTLLSFGQYDVNNIWYGAYNMDHTKTEFEFFITLSGVVKSIKLTFKQFVLPKVYQEVFAATILCALTLQITAEQIKNSLEEHFSLPKGRGSLIPGIKQSIIIDSSYNSSSDSVISLLSLLGELKSQTKRPTVFLFGDMRELGSQERAEHEKVAEYAFSVADYIYCVGPLTQQYVIPLVEKHRDEIKEIRWFSTSHEAGLYMKSHLPEHCLILVKGSQNQIYLEEAIGHILKNTADKKLLCRQDQYWQEIKKRYFASFSIVT